MNKKIRLNLSRRRTGATTRMLKKAEKNHGIMLCYSDQLKNHYEHEARRLGYTHIIFKNYGSEALRGLERRPVYIDNFEFFIHKQLLETGMIDSISEINISTDWFRIENNLSRFKRFWYTIFRGNKYVNTK